MILDPCSTVANLQVEQMLQYSELEIVGLVDSEDKIHHEEQVLQPATKLYQMVFRSSEFDRTRVRPVYQSQQAHMMIGTDSTIETCPMKQIHENSQLEMVNYAGLKYKVHQVEQVRRPLTVAEAA